MTAPASQIMREAGTTSGIAYDIDRIRADFPILAERVGGKPLTYLDNAATSQKPRAVIDAVRAYYEHENSNVHRGVHVLSQKATELYEGAREKVRRFINAPSVDEIIFVRGTTEGINLVMQTFGRSRVGTGDEVLITELEHHSNIVPWQLLCEQAGATLKVAPIDDRGVIDMDVFASRIGKRTKLVALSHISNALGTINPVREMVAVAHAHGLPVLVDGAQAVPHMAVDVRDLDCDFYVFSGHKMYGPTGIGAVWGRAEHLEAMPPFMGGGDMILSVTFEKTVYNKVPHKFEAGTPNIAGTIGLGAAIDYLQAAGLEPIAAHEAELLTYGTAVLEQIPGLRLIGTAPDKASVISFVLEGIHAHDLGTILDQEGIAIRTGHHCAQPVMDHFGVPATARASIGLYNTRDELDRLGAALRYANEVFG